MRMNIKDFFRCMDQYEICNVLPGSQWETATIVFPQKNLQSSKFLTLKLGKTSAFAKFLLFNN